MLLLHKLSICPLKKVFCHVQMKTASHPHSLLIHCRSSHLMVGGCRSPIRAHSRNLQPTPKNGGRYCKVASLSSTVYMQRFMGWVPGAKKTRAMSHPKCVLRGYTYIHAYIHTYIRTHTYIEHHIYFSHRVPSPTLIAKQLTFDSVSTLDLLNLDSKANDMHHNESSLLFYPPFSASYICQPSSCQCRWRTTKWYVPVHVHLHIAVHM